MPVTLPTRLDDGTVADLEYLDLTEVAAIVPLSADRIRKRLAARDWGGSYIGGRWYMTRADIAAAIGAAHHGPAVHLDPPDNPPTLGLVLDEDQIDDLDGVR